MAGTLYAPRHTKSTTNRPLQAYRTGVVPALEGGQQRMGGSDAHEAACTGMAAAGGYRF